MKISTAEPALPKTFPNLTTDILQFSYDFFEDIAKNLLPAHNLGMKTAWVENDDDYCKEGYDGKHVHYRVKSLIDFLTEINKNIN